MDYISWIKKRNPAFILKRGRSLFDHYGIGPQKAMQSINILMDCFMGFEAPPTFSVPGRVIEKNPAFIRTLQDRGAEIAVHGYNHIDLKARDTQDALSQLLHAIKVFKANDLEAHGFRCPYLSCSDELIEAIPHGVFEYSSNKALRWDFERSKNGKYNQNVLRTIDTFYMAEEAKSMCSLPWFRNGMVEIPVIVPDDLQFKDGLGYDQKDLENVWGNLLKITYDKAELFNLLFHPELASFCLNPFKALLQTARAYSPRVWVARLCDIAQWWNEKSAIKANINGSMDGNLTITFPESVRARWVVRGIVLPDTFEWLGSYRTLPGRSYKIPGNIRPFLGIDDSFPAAMAEKLSNHGYILDKTESAKSCSIYLDGSSLQDFPTEAALTNMIEGSDSPLIRLWPWPDGYYSALCITGDLDALSLGDYFSRLRSD